MQSSNSGASRYPNHRPEWMEDDLYLAIISSVEQGTLDLEEAADLMLQEEDARAWYALNWGFDPY